MKKLMLSLLCSAFIFTTQAQVAKKPIPKKVVSKKVVKGKPVVINKTKTVTVKNVIDKSLKVKITTDSGIIVVKLYDSTPLHRDNFVKLVKQGFYDSLLFHRIIQGFMIQGGDPTSKNAEPGAMLGGGGGDMARIPAEFRKSIIHKKGALAAARDGNPEKASSACQFYIVEGKTLSDAELDMMEQRIGSKYTLAQRNMYKKIGGTAMLDQNYTVFGEVISGLEVVDKIASAPKASGDRPSGDIRMKMEVMK
ncbi:MAG: peptidylprolyl isomerase [Ferruginibacter sp.]|nr:peptidylprolyl isomerase [Ferruginibacter sp.]